MLPEKLKSIQIRSSRISSQTSFYQEKSTKFKTNLLKRIFYRKVWQGIFRNTLFLYFIIRVLSVSYAKQTLCNSRFYFFSAVSFNLTRWKGRKTWKRNSFGNWIRIGRWGIHLRNSDLGTEAQNAPSNIEYGIKNQILKFWSSVSQLINQMMKM